MGLPLIHLCQIVYLDGYISDWNVSCGMCLPFKFYVKTTDISVVEEEGTTKNVQQWFNGGRGICQLFSYFYESFVFKMICID